MWQCKNELTFTPCGNPRQLHCRLPSAYCNRRFNLIILFFLLYLLQPDKEDKLFVIKPIPTLNVKPVIIFINPKSGGNQGVKLLQKFQWHLNPRQVFDLSRGGPGMGLELYKKVPNLRVLACGGDGTVGWVLSILDRIANAVSFPVGVLPLGTGNDLARALGWGGVSIDQSSLDLLTIRSHSRHD